jgi:pimeloyl-ACP methyl ester carboxylesterase
MHKTSRSAGLVLLTVFQVFMLAACRRATPTSLILPFPTVSNPAKIEDLPCPFQTESTGPEVTCGKLAVPEDYMDPQGAQIHLFVATVHSTGDKPALEPVIVLYQDYDVPFVENAARYAAYDPFLSEILKEHDLVLYEFRGVGLSEPDTACAEVAPAQFGVMGQNLDRAARSKAIAGIYQACRDKLVHSGIRLENYTTAQNVADLNSVTNALEGKKVNLLAIGYGAYLSLRVMQDNPDRIRSALLSSPYNLQIVASGAAAKLQNILTQVFASCKASKECNAAYPSLEDDFYAAVDKLNRNPAEIPLVGTSLNGQEFPVLVTGDMFLDLARFMLGIGETSSLPSLVYYINLDRTYHLSKPLQDFQGYLGLSNPGVGMSVYCQAYLGQQARPLAKGQANQALVDWQVLAQQTDELTCPGWFTGKVQPSENPGRPSSVPALVLYSEWNPYTPTAWVEDNFQSFTNVRLVKVPSTGWVYWTGTCIPQFAAAFLDDPNSQPDTSCAAATPEVQFILPIK